MKMLRAQRRTTAARLLLHQRRLRLPRMQTQHGLLRVVAAGILRKSPQVDHRVGPGDTKGVRRGPGQSQGHDRGRLTGATDETGVALADDTDLTAIQGLHGPVLGNVTDQHHAHDRDHGDASLPDHPRVGEAHTTPAGIRDRHEAPRLAIASLRAHLASPTTGTVCPARRVPARVAVPVTRRRPTAQVQARWSAERGHLPTPKEPMLHWVNPVPPPKSGTSGGGMSLREKLKRRMQAALNKQYKADKKAEREKQDKVQQERWDRAEELREMALRLRQRDRERRHKEWEDYDPENGSRWSSRSRSRSGSRSSRSSPEPNPPGESPPRRASKRSRSRSPTPDDRRHHDMDWESRGLVDY